MFRPVSLSRSAWLSVRALDLRSLGRGFDSHLAQICVATLGELSTPLSPNSITWYRSKDTDVLQLGRWPQAWEKKLQPSYLSGAWLKNLPACWLPVHRDHLLAQRSVTSMGKFYLFITNRIKVVSVLVNMVNFWPRDCIYLVPHSVNTWPCNLLIGPLNDTACFWVYCLLMLPRRATFWIRRYKKDSLTIEGVVECCTKTASPNVRWSLRRSQTDKLSDSL